MIRLEWSFFSSDIINIDVKKRGLLFQTNNKTKTKVFLAFGLRGTESN
jgi:hypothetical protein